MRWQFTRLSVLIAVALVVSLIPTSTTALLLLNPHTHNIENEYPNCTDRPPRQGIYDVVVTELDAVGEDGAALISQVNGSSDFE